MSSAPPSVRTPRPPAPRRTRTWARLAATAAALVVLVPAAASAAPLEDFSGYEPQTRCSPTAKSGTVALSTWLMKQYPGSGSLGISRACGHGGTSEHKEGRAFDWALDATSARDRGYAKDFFGRILAPDAEGNPAALARRMGIMYLIWDDHIYASYRQFEKKRYLSPGCRSVTKCSVTLRHRNHVHISLSRAGGKGDTSWYHRDDPSWGGPTTPTPPTTPVPPSPVTPPPVTTPEPPPSLGPPVEGELKLSRTKPYAKVRVPLDGSTHRSKWQLRKGKKYKLTVAGVVGFTTPDQAADGSCAWSPTARAWTAAPTVKVDGDAVFGDTCQDSHVYTATYVPRKSKKLRVKLAGAPATTGKLVLTVSKKRADVTRALPTYPALAAAPTARASVRGLGMLAETVQVPAASTEPVSTTQEVEAGARYRVTVSGVVDLGGGVQSDGQCIGIAGQWYAAASLDRRYPGADHGNLYLDGLPFDGAPVTDCSTHTHVMELTAAESRQLQLALWDPLGPTGNTGALTVTVQRLTGLPAPRQARGERPEASTPWTQPRDWFPVALATADGTVSTMRVRKGDRVTVVVTGTYSSHGVTADATCVASAAGWTQRDPGLALEQDPLELWVDGELRAWQPTGAATGACSDGHGYTTSYVAEKSGPVRFAVLDLDHRDNAGTLEVTLVRS